MLYFKKEAARELKTADDYEQFSRVLRFRDEFAPQGLYWEFHDAPEFERLVQRAIRHSISSIIFLLARRRLPAGPIIANCTNAIARRSSKNFPRSIFSAKNAAPAAARTAWPM
jgi:hypothetical protein